MEPGSESCGEEEAGIFDESAEANGTRHTRPSEG